MRELEAWPLARLLFAILHGRHGRLGGFLSQTMPLPAPRLCVARDRLQRGLKHVARQFSAGGRHVVQYNNSVPGIIYSSIISNSYTTTTDSTVVLERKIDKKGPRTKYTQTSEWSAAKHHWKPDGIFFFFAEVRLNPSWLSLLYTGTALRVLKIANTLGFLVCFLFFFLFLFYSWFPLSVGFAHEQLALLPLLPATTEHVSLYYHIIVGKASARNSDVLIRGERPVECDDTHTHTHCMRQMASSTHLDFITS